MQLLSSAHLEAEVEALGRGRYCVDPYALIAAQFVGLTPPEEISTTEAATRYRKLRNAEGDGWRYWSAELTPYILGVHDALDDPLVREVIVAGPGRCGKTVGFTNYEFKRMRFGPATDILHYLGSDSEVDAYVDREVTPMFDLHPELKAKLGPLRTDDKRKFKRVGGRAVEFLPANHRTITQREAAFIYADETDSYRPRIRAAFRDSMRQRGRAIGNRRKVGMASHPDAGFGGGIAGWWRESSRGMWGWPCESCGLWSSPCQEAEHRTRLHYQRGEKLTDDEALDLARRTAAMLCPHCGTMLDDDARHRMIDLGEWFHRGQTLDPTNGPTGQREPSEAMGFWIHALMTKMIDLPTLAVEGESAMRHYEKTRDPTRIREFTAKTLGEVYEGAGGTGRALRPEELAKRVSGFAAGTVPDGVMFLTAAVDVGHAKFDVMIVGWDLEGKSWVIDRTTIQQRVVGGRLAGLRPAERQEDWWLLEHEVVSRVLPFANDPTRGLPVAGIAIDTGDGHVTAKAREFARAMQRKRYAWGQWDRVRLIKGVGGAKTAELPDKGRDVNVDEEGRSLGRPLLEWGLGVDKLKSLIVERLSVGEESPGIVRFAEGLPRSALEEFTGEVLLDGKWVRHGPNESLDLMAYAEAVRLMLQPDRPDINWTVRPVWARPVPVGNEEENNASPATATQQPTASRLDRLAALNQRR